jgi:hypothetical protein
MKRIVHILIAISIATALIAQEAPKNTVLKSIILPGWGELAYQSNSAYVQNEDLISFSRLHAGLDQYPNKDEFWADMGNYISYLEHQESMLENRTPEKIWSTDYQWEWDTNDNLLAYDSMFRAKELTLIGSEFVITGLIVNRIASVINVRYLRNKNMQLSAFAAPLNGGGVLQLGLTF